MYGLSFLESTKIVLDVVEVSIKDTGCHWFKEEIFMIWTNFFWSNTLLVIFTCDLTLLNNKNLITSFKKGGLLKFDTKLKLLNSVNGDH